MQTLFCLVYLLEMRNYSRIFLERTNSTYMDTPILANFMLSNYTQKKSMCEHSDTCWLKDIFRKHFITQKLVTKNNFSRK